MPVRAADPGRSYASPMFSPRLVRSLAIASIIAVCGGCTGSDEGAGPSAPDTTVSVLDAPPPPADEGPPATDVSVEPDTGGAVPDPVVRDATRPIGTPPRVWGAIASRGAHVAWCDGDDVTLAGAAGLIEQWSAALTGPCRSVAIGEAALVAADDAGLWSTFERETGGAIGSAALPQPLDLAWHGGRIIGALGAGGLITVAADLAAPPASVDGLDARGVVAWDERVAVAHALGVSLFSHSGSGELTALSTWSAGEAELPTGLARAHEVVVVTVMGRGLAVLGTGGDELVELGSAVFSPRGLPMDVAVSADGLHAAAADWNGVRVLDLSAQTPAAVAREPFGVQSAGGARATGVAATPQGFAVLGVDHVTAVEVRADQPAAELDLQPRWLFLTASEEAGGSAAVLVSNTGSLDLRIDAIEPASARVTATTDTPLTVEPGGMEVLDLLVSGGEPMDTELVLHTNDPDAGAHVLPMTVNPDILNPGDPAADFLVPSTSGELVSLGDFAGKLLYLRLFNAQCEGCLAELPIIEADFYQVYKDQGFAAAGLHLGDNLATALSFQRQTGITFDILLDQDLHVLRRYARGKTSKYLFPLVYLIDESGVVQQVYQDAEVPHDELAATVEALLP